MGMIRKNFYLTIEQDTFLKKQKDLSYSEHLRRAIDSYIFRLKNMDAQVSLSERKVK